MPDTMLFFVLMTQCVPSHPHKHSPEEDQWPLRSPQGGLVLSSLKGETALLLPPLGFQGTVGAWL